MAGLILAVIASLIAASAASTPININNGEDATFSWPLPVSAQGKLVTVVNPHGASVLDWGPDCTVITSFYYSHRVRVSCKNASNVTFTLLGVTWPDEGPYTCRAITPSGALIVDCGQNLTLIKAPPKVHIEFNTPDTTALQTEGKSLTLTCVVTQAFPPVPEDGYSWSYRPSPQAQLRPLVGKTRTLTLGPLTTQDSGQYFCQASNDPDNRWNILPVTVSVALKESCIDAILRSDVSPQAVVEKDRDGFTAVFVLGQHPGLIVIQHPNTFSIVVWHAPCNFTVTDAFKHRVTNMSCNPCQRALSFSLVNVTTRDLGRYQCFAGTTHGAKLDSCSVELISKVPIQVHMEPRTPDHVVKGAEGSHLTLTCVVTQALPPVPEDGYSWSYLPSPQGRLRPLVGKTCTLTLGPLTLKDRGQYFCQARNDLTNRGNIPPGIASATVDVSSGVWDGPWQNTIVVLLGVILVVVLTIAVGFFLYRWRRRRRKSFKNFLGKEKLLESQQTNRKRTVSLSKESNRETRTSTQEIAVEAVVKAAELDNEDETSPLIERQATKRPRTPSQESNSEARTRTEETVEAEGTGANLVDEDETDPAIYLISTKRPRTPSQESNSEARTEQTVEAGGMGASLVFVGKIGPVVDLRCKRPFAHSNSAPANLDDEGRTDPVVDARKRPPSPSQESNSEARTEETVEAGRTAASLVEEERNGPEVDLKSMKRPPSPSQESNSETRTEQTVEAGETGANLADEGKTDPAVDHKSRERPLSPSQKSNSEARTEQTAEAGGTGANLVEEEKTDPWIYLKHSKELSTQSQKSTCLTTPRGDKSSKVDQMHTKSREAKSDPLLGSIVDSG